MSRQPHVVGIGPNKPCDWCGRSDYCLDPFFCFLHLQIKEKTMSCSRCEERQRGDLTAPYRWGTANIEVKGCDEHLNEVFAVLNKHQKLKSSGGVDSKYGNLGISGVPSNEPVFVLRAQDAHAVFMLQEYQRLVGSHNKVMEERMDLVIARFKAWQVKKLHD